MAPLGSGFVGVFRLNGRFVRRFATGGSLSSPEGLAKAPANFGRYSNDVLIGNHNRDALGFISAFDPATGQFRGRLTQDGKPIVLPDVSHLHFGADTRSSWLFFDAGIGEGGNDGLFGKITVAGTGS